MPGIQVTSAQAALDLFRSPKKTLGDLDADAAAKLIAVATDIALVVDSKGIVRDVACGSAELSREGFDRWIGKRWVDTVTSECQTKISDLLREAAAGAPPRSRQVNHTSDHGPDVPIRYTAVSVNDQGRVVAVGRDLRAIAALQQRLIESQQSMEQEFARLRHAETRYRLLFQVATEAVLIVDASSLKVVEANPAATRLFVTVAKKMTGRTFPDFFDSAGVRAVQGLLAATKTSGRAEDVVAKLSGSSAPVTVSASLFRQENVSHFLIRIATTDSASVASADVSNIFDFVDKLPDGFVVTDPDGRILKTNTAFLELAQIASEEQAEGQPLDRWLGRHDVDVKVLIDNVKDRGAIRNFSSVVRGEFGTQENVDVSAVAVATGERPCLGFTVRLVGHKADAGYEQHRELPRSVEQMTELVGRVSLKELVRDTTDIIERLCIEAALELTGDNRASAAEMLGLSRQGLYSKLRRYGLGDLDSSDESH